MIPVYILIAGQSIAQAAYSAASLAALTEELNREGYTPVVTTAGWGGSSALKQNAPTAHPTWYWWDEDTNTNGTLMVQTIATITALPLATRPDFIFMLDNEADAKTTTDPAVLLNANKWILWNLRKACDPNVVNDNTLVPTWHDIVGRHSFNPTALQMVRENQLELTQTTSCQFMFDKFDLPLKMDDPLGRWPGDVHPLSPGEAILGFRIAQCILAHYGKDHVSAPEAAIVRTGTNTIKVSVPSNLFHPVTPEGFAVRDSSGFIYENLTFSWAGDDLTITVPVTGSVDLLYPYGGLMNLNRDNLIRDRFGTPLKTFAEYGI